MTSKGGHKKLKGAVPPFRPLSPPPPTLGLHMFISLYLLYKHPPLPKSKHLPTPMLFQWFKETILIAGSKFVAQKL